MFLDVNLSMENRGNVNVFNFNLFSKSKRLWLFWCLFDTLQMKVVRNSLFDVISSWCTFLKYFVFHFEISYVIIKNILYSSVLEISVFQLIFFNFFFWKLLEKTSIFSKFHAYENIREVLSFVITLKN